eukprot:GEMP01006925.1.p1 GENE.GEMP01006925.1~~GEMP01006925.1.p1  ORF type:complete len:788 (+),score=274.99 GEMP01006925.1:286-2649(+)
MAAPGAKLSLSLNGGEAEHGSAPPPLSTPAEFINGVGASADGTVGPWLSDYSPQVTMVEATIASLRAELAVYHNEQPPEMCQSSALENTIARLQQENDKLRRAVKYQEAEAYLKVLPENLQTIEKEMNVLRNLAASEVSTMKQRARSEGQRVLSAARSRAATTREAANAMAEALVEKLNTANSLSALAECDKAMVENSKFKYELSEAQAELKKIKTSFALQRKHNEKLKTALASAEQKVMQAKVASTARLRMTPRNGTPRRPMTHSVGVSCRLESQESSAAEELPSESNKSFEVVRLRDDVRHCEQALQNEIKRQNDNVEKAVAEALREQDVVHKKTVTTLHAQAHTSEDEIRLLRRRTLQLEKQQTSLEQERTQHTTKRNRMEEEEEKLQTVLRDELEANVAMHDKLHQRLREESAELNTVTGELHMVKALNNELAIGLRNIEELEATQREHDKCENQRQIDQMTASMSAQLEQRERAHTCKIEQLRKHYKRAAVDNARKAESEEREELLAAQADRAKGVHLLAKAQTKIKSLRTQLNTHVGNERVLENLLQEQERAQSEREEATRHAHSVELCHVEERLRTEAEANLRACEAECVENAKATTELAHKEEECSKALAEKLAEMEAHRDALLTTVADIRGAYEVLEQEQACAKEEAEAATLTGPKQCLDCEAWRSRAAYWEKCANTCMLGSSHMGSARMKIGTPRLTSSTRASSNRDSQSTVSRRLSSGGITEKTAVDAARRLSIGNAPEWHEVARRDVGTRRTPRRTPRLSVDGAFTARGPLVAWK